MSWEAFAIRFATAPRAAHRCFLAGEDEGMRTIAFHMALLRGPGGWVAMDTAQNADQCARAKRGFLRPVEDAFAALGCDPATVGHVIQTHLHADHAGQPHLFPAARFHLQARELAYVNGPVKRHAVLRAGYDADDIAAMEALVQQGRVDLHNGNAEPLPGLELYHVGGHTDGLQIVRLRTAKGWLVLATDSVALRDNLEQRRPFPAVYHVGDALDAFDTVLRLADAPELVIAGHDPRTTDAPAALPGSEGWIARLA